MQLSVGLAFNRTGVHLFRLFMSITF